MDEIRNQLNVINFTALTGRIMELEDTRRVAQLTQTDEFEEDGSWNGSSISAIRWYAFSARKPPRRTIPYWPTTGTSRTAR
jgi:hypothetical protein